MEVGHELATEEVHDLCGADAQRAVAEQARVQLAQSVRSIEHHVGGVLGLRGDPLVLASAQYIVELRYHLPGVAAQDPRPVQVGEAIGQALRARQLADTDEDVVDLRVFDTAGRELALQTLVAVEGDLHLQREPGLHAHVQQAKTKLGLTAQGKLAPEVTPGQAEIARLRAEVARLKMERDIAKKAAAYYAQDVLQGTPGSGR